MDRDASYSATHVEELLRCPICLDRYNHPKQLPCQHTVCKSPCLARLIATNPRVLHCPQCRIMHPVPAGGVNAYPDNIIVNNLLDLPRTAASSTFKCHDCERRENLSICSHCDQQICAECRPQHLTSIRDDVQTTVERLRSKLPQLSQRVTECNQRVNGVQVYFQRLRQEVTENVETHIRALNARKQRLLTEIDVLEQSKLSELSELQEKSEMDTASAASFCESAEKDLHNIASPTTLQKLKKDCENFLKDLDKSEPLNSLNDVRFNHDDVTLTSVIENYGGITSGGHGAVRQVPTRTNAPAVTPRINQQHAAEQTPRRRAFESDFRSNFPDDFLQTFPSRQTNASSLFGTYPTNRRRSSPPTQAPPIQEAFSGFISLENPNFRRRRPRNQPATVPRRRTHPGRQAASGPAPLRRQNTFTRDDDDDDDDIVTTSDSRRPISFQISLNDAPLPPRTPNSLETTRPVNNYQQKHGHKTIDTRRGQPWFQHCTGVTTAPDTDNLYFVDEHASKILVFDTNGRHIKTFGNDGELDKPFDAVFKGDTIYITDTGNNRVQAFNADGQIRPSQVNYNFQSPKGISSDADNLYVCDSGHGKVCVIGEQVASFHHDQLPHPTFISAARHRIVVSDPDVNSVFVFSADGSLLRRFGQEGSAVGDLLRPMGVQMDFQGFILVSNSSNSRIDVFRENGTFYCAFGERGQGQGQFSQLQGLAVTSNGRVVICDGTKAEIF